MSVVENPVSEVKFMASVMDEVHKASATLFNNNNTLRINLLDYLQRIHHYSECLNSCFILAMILIDRVMEAHGRKPKPLPFTIHT